MYDQCWCYHDPYTVHKWKNCHKHGRIRFFCNAFFASGPSSNKIISCVCFNNGRCEMTNGVASNAPTRVDRARHLAQMQQYESLEMQPMCLSPSKRDATRVSLFVKKRCDPCVFVRQKEMQPMCLCPSKSAESCGSSDEGRDCCIKNWTEGYIDAVAAFYCHIEHIYSHMIETCSFEHCVVVLPLKMLYTAHNVLQGLPKTGTYLYQHWSLRTIYIQTWSHKLALYRCSCSFLLSYRAHTLWRPNEDYVEELVVPT